MGVTEEERWEEGKIRQDKTRSPHLHTQALSRDGDIGATAPSRLPLDIFLSETAPLLHITRNMDPIICVAFADNGIYPTGAKTPMSESTICSRLNLAEASP